MEPEKCQEHDNPSCDEVWESEMSDDEEDSDGGEVGGFHRRTQSVELDVIEEIELQSTAGSMKMGIHDIQSTSGASTSATVVQHKDITQDPLTLVGDLEGKLPATTKDAVSNAPPAGRKDSSLEKKQKKKQEKEEDKRKKVEIKEKKERVKAKRKARAEAKKAEAKVMKMMIEKALNEDLEYKGAAAENARDEEIRRWVGDTHLFEIVRYGDSEKRALLWKPTPFETGGEKECFRNIEAFQSAVNAALKMQPSYKRLVKIVLAEFNGEELLLTSDKALDLVMTHKPAYVTAYYTTTNTGHGLIIPKLSLIVVLKAVKKVKFVGSAVAKVHSLAKKL